MGGGLPHNAARCAGMGKQPWSAGHLHHQPLLWPSHGRMGHLVPHQMRGNLFEKLQTHFRGWQSEATIVDARPYSQSCLPRLHRECHAISYIIVLDCSMLGMTGHIDAGTLTGS